MSARARGSHHVAVVGNVAVDRVDGGPPTPGGCPPFAARAFRLLGRGGEILTRCAERDRPLVEPALAAPGVRVTVLPAGSTAAFRLHERGERREVAVDALGEPWRPEDTAPLEPRAGWVHAAPLLRGDLPAETLAALAAGGRRLSLDGQGLVRVRALGPLRLDDRFDPALLAPLAALKLAEEEAEAIACGRFRERHARALGVPEVLVTLGARGCTLYVEGAEEHVPAAGPVTGVHTTGAGDAFMVAYAVARCAGAEPRAAAEGAAELVARLLEERRRSPTARPREG